MRGEVKDGVISKQTTFFLTVLPVKKNICTTQRNVVSLNCLDLHLEINVYSLLIRWKQHRFFLCEYELETSFF